MSEASSAVTYTSVYTDSEPRRVFWGPDKELSDGGSPRVIVYGYDGLPMLAVAPPSPDYIPGLEEPQKPPAPQDEDDDEHELMFIQPHDLDFVPEPIYPEYIPLKDEHILLAEEQPLPPEYEEDEAEDGPVDYPIDGGDDGDDEDDDDSSGYDVDKENEDDEDEEEEEEEHLASADFAVIIPIDDLRLARCTAPAALPSPSLPPFSYPPPPVDRKDGVPESEQPPRKRLCLSTLGFRDVVGESSTRGRGVDYRFTNTVEAEMRRRGIREVGYGIRNTWIDSAEAVPEMTPTTLEKETVWIVGEEAYAAREAWAQLVGLNQTANHELQTLREQVYAQEYQLQAHQAQLQLQSTLIQTQQQLHETHSQMQQTKMAGLRETDRV
nr:hypothetical protein [Tanacetum cinerariifolium]